MRGIVLRSCLAGTTSCGSREGRSSHESDLGIHQSDRYAQLRELNLRDRVQAVVPACQAGIVDPEPAEPS